jgi:phage baseplate assembly protein W
MPPSEVVAATLSFPFRLLPNGSAATVEQVSDQGYAERIAQLILTRPGEREMAPGFGIPDAAFAGLSASDLVAAVAAYGPPVTIEKVTSTPQPDGITQATTVGWT